MYSKPTTGSTPEDIAVDVQKTFEEKLDLMCIESEEIRKSIEKDGDLRLKLEKLAADKKSIAYTFHYRSPERTLKAKEVDEAHQKLLDYLAKSLPITFR